MKVLNVLVVEDEPSNREIIEIILQTSGHRVTACSNGKEALDLLFNQDKRFDLVILDVQMPEVNGIDAARALRGNPRTQNLPLIIVSARASGPDQEAGMEAGADLYLAKPFSRRQLVRAIDEVLIHKGVLAPDETIASRT